MNHYEYMKKLAALALRGWPWSEAPTLGADVAWAALMFGNGQLAAEEDGWLGGAL